MQLPRTWRCTPGQWPAAAADICGYLASGSLRLGGGSLPAQEGPKASNPGTRELGVSLGNAHWTTPSCTQGDLQPWLVLALKVAKISADTQRTAGEISGPVAFDSILWKLGQAVVNKCLVAFAINSEKSPCVSESVKFKSMLFKGQLCMLVRVYSKRERERQRNRDREAKRDRKRKICYWGLLMWLWRLVSPDPGELLVYVSIVSRAWDPRKAMLKFQPQCESKC